MRILSSVIILIAAGAGAFAQDPKPPASSIPAVPQPVRILSQPDAPLRIISADTSWAMPNDRTMVQVFVVVKNVSDQLVRTYATRRGVESNSSSKACLGPPGMIGRGLQPGQTAGTSSWQGISNSDPWAVWIDFVEMSDGSRWGADKCEIGERLDGERSGMRAQRDQLLTILREKGA